MAVILSRSRTCAGKLEPATFEGALRRILFSIGEFEHRTANRAAGLSEQLLPVFRMRLEFLRRAGAPEGFAHRIEAVAHRLGAGMLPFERQVGVVAHATIGAGLVEIGR